MPSDMDNNHMLSMIEQKMSADDRKVWARELEREGKPATLHALMSWMAGEMKSRMRATAPIRTGPNQQRNTRRSVNYVKGDDSTGKKAPKHKCWLCQSWTHWPDQCEKFAALNVHERLKTAKENHVCFSCLKKAGREHKMAN